MRLSMFLGALLLGFASALNSQAGMIGTTVDNINITGNVCVANFPGTARGWHALTTREHVNQHAYPGCAGEGMPP